MLARTRMPSLLLTIGMMGPLVAGCGDDGPTGPIFTNPATITVQNELDGPVLFFFVRPCGTTDFGEDLLPSDPVEGTIQPGDSKDFTVEAGCYDMRVLHLVSVSPGPPVTKEIFDKQVTAAAGFTWRLTSDPDPA